MSDVPDMAAKKKLGRFQKIAIAFTAVPYAMSYALVWAGKLTGEVFWQNSWPFIVGALTVIGGGSAWLKTKVGQPNA